MTKWNDETRKLVMHYTDAGHRAVDIAGVMAKHHNTHIPDSSIRDIIRSQKRERDRQAKLDTSVRSAMVGKLSAPSIAKLPDLTPQPPKESKRAPFRIAVIPDVQAKHGNDFTFLKLLGQYIAEQRPDVIVNIGDFADMPSLSSHDAPGAHSVEGRRYHLDIDAVQEAMLALMTPIREEMAKGWNPRLVLTLGNHEHRIARALEANPKLIGTIQMDDLRYADWGWEVVPFKEIIIIEGVAFCHYFTTGQMGRPASSARAMLNKQHMSCFAGHQQGRDMALGKRGDGRQITAIICGSCYEHDEEYLGAQGNKHFRGFYLLNDVRDGEFEELPVTLRYLRWRYEGTLT